MASENFDTYADIYDNGGHVNDVYANENGIGTPQIPTISYCVQPPKYDEVFKPPNAGSTSQNFPPNYGHSYPQVLTQQPVIAQPRFIGADDGGFRHKKLHIIHGVLSLVFGCIIMMLDPLLPALFQYYYSMFVAGLFMVISGLCSIHGSKKSNKCSLKAALTFNIFSLILLFVGYIMGIVAAGYPIVSLPCRYSTYECSYQPSIYFYVNGIQGLAIFNTIYGIILFVFVLWDSTIKCGTLCCRKQTTLQTSPQTNHPQAGIQILTINH